MSLSQEIFSFIAFFFLILAATIYSFLIIKGPYNIETDASDKLNGLENDLLEEIKQKILTKAIEEKKQTFMLAETAAYLCDLGQGKEKSLGEKCRKTHENSRGDAKSKKEKKLVVETRKLVYSTIVEFYDAKVARNVAAATLDVVGKIVKAGTNADLAATYSSAIKIGNEN
jgi:hypothetical protein